MPVLPFNLSLIQVRYALHQDHVFYFHTKQKGAKKQTKVTPTSYLQYEARLSPGFPKFGWHEHPSCRQRRDVTFTIPAILCLAQYDARRSP